MNTVSPLDSLNGARKGRMEIRVLTMDSVAITANRAKNSDNSAIFGDFRAWRIGV